MPQIFKIGPYWVYFWSNESNPLEPIHVHISEGQPSPHSTKIWITHSHKCLLANNNSNIPSSQLKLLIRFIEANIDEILEKWHDHFGVTHFYC